jgi:sodium/potassium-transporting ATPase subunit alpha
MDIDEKQPVQRIRFGDQITDEEAVEHVGFGARSRRLSRQSSIGSLSIHSAGGARTVQPETALPITYRTLSIEINEGQHEKQKEVKKAKEKAAVGMLLKLPKLHQTTTMRVGPVYQRAHTIYMTSITPNITF